MNSKYIVGTQEMAATVIETVCHDQLVPGLRGREGVLQVP